MPLTVACVLRASKEYDAGYVEALQRGVAKHLTIPHRFVCLSDVWVPCERIELEHQWPGWWAKMELFKLDPPVLYFDLDTIITGNLDEIAGAALLHPFIVLRDFYREKGVGSGMMAWHSDKSELYKLFALMPASWQTELRTRGDQAFIEGHAKDVPAKWQDVLPGQVCSYKVHVKDKGIPQDCRVVCFHGRPKPRDLAWTI